MLTANRTRAVSTVMRRKLVSLPSQGMTLDELRASPLLFSGASRHLADAHSTLQNVSSARTSTRASPSSRAARTSRSSATSRDATSKLPSVRLLPLFCRSLRNLHAHALSFPQRKLSSRASSRPTPLASSARKTTSRTTLSRSARCRRPRPTAMASSVRTSGTAARRASSTSRRSSIRCAGSSASESARKARPADFFMPLVPQTPLTVSPKQPLEFVMQLFRRMGCVGRSPSSSACRPS